MMNSTKDLAAELRQLIERRDALGDDVERAGSALEGARAALVSDKGAVAKVTAAQSEYSALSEALNSLDASITERREQLAEAEAREAEVAKQERLAELHATRERLQTEYTAARAEADTSIGEHAARILDLMRRNTEACREMEQLVPRPSHTTYTSVMAGRELRTEPSLYGNVLVSAMHTLARKLELERQQDRVRPPDEEGAARLLYSDAVM